MLAHWASCASRRHFYHFGHGHACRFGCIHIQSFLQGTSSNLKPILCHTQITLFSHSQIFLMVVVFGLFFGIIFLPVVLSLVGPQPYRASAASGPKIRCADEHANGNTEMKSFIDKNGRTNDDNESKENQQLKI